MSKMPKSSGSSSVDGEIIPQEIKEIAEDIPEEVVDRIVEVTTTRIHQSEMWSGPLPPPDIFKQYPVEVQKAIVNQATAQMKHRHKIEATVVASNVRNSTKGMSFAFWLTIAMMAAGTGLVAMGHSTAGLVAIFGTGGFQGGNFLFQKWREMQRASKNAKQQNEDAIDSPAAKKDQ